MKRIPPTNVRAVVALGVTAVLVTTACSGTAKKTAATVTTTSTTSTTTTEPPTTTTAVPGVAAPLTGLPADAATAPLLSRPALAVKIDNSTDAMPQEGLNQADVVFEIKVEGISRLMAVFHSQNAGEIGPTRSARYSDPPILALLGRPLFGWSGANDGVTKDVQNSSWIVNVNWDRFQKDYYRKSGRAAPHNLFTSTDSLFGHAQPDQPAPRPLFQYLDAGQALTNGATPMPGVTLNVGDTPSAWAWDAAGNHWLRWQYGRRDETVGHGQADATNVVVMEIRYKGGSKAPVAISEGTGAVTLLTAGGMAAIGTWSRPSQLEGFTLTGADGQPMRLAPGRTWIELTDGHTVTPMTPDQAAKLLAG